MGVASAAISLGLAAVSISLAARSDAGSVSLPVRTGCPAALEQVGPRVGSPSFDATVAAARRVLYREVTHFQGRSERRAAANTPVVGVLMHLGWTPVRVEGQRRLLAQAARLCGRHVATASSAVLFHDGLNVICCQTITLYVVRTDRSLRVFPRRAS